MPTVLGPQRLDTDRDYDLTLTDADGVAADLSGLATLAVMLAPGSGLAAVATLAAVVQGDPTAGVVRASVNASVVSALPPGRYAFLATGTTDAGRPLDLAADYALDLAPGVGTHAASAALTRAKVERTLVRRCRGWMAAPTPSLDLSDAGGNPDLADPIAEALRFVGAPPADPTEPADADLASVATADAAALLDVAELRTMETCLGRFNQVSWSRDTLKQHLSDFADRLRAAIECKAADCRLKHGYGLAAPVAATLDLGFAARGDDPEIEDA